MTRHKASGPGIVIQHTVHILAAFAPQADSAPKAPRQSNCPRRTHHRGSLIVPSDIAYTDAKPDSARCTTKKCNGFSPSEICLRFAIPASINRVAHHIVERTPDIGAAVDTDIMIVFIDIDLIAAMCLGPSPIAVTLSMQPCGYSQQN